MLWLLILWPHLKIKNNVYHELGWSVNDHLKQIQYSITVSIKTEIYIVEQMKNLAFNKTPAIVLKNAFPGKTAFILAGGPSMDLALDWLKLNRKKVILFAVSRIIRRLNEVGLEADFIVSVDPAPVNYTVSKELLLVSQKPVFIYGYHVYSKLISQWQGRALYLDARVPWQSSLNVENLPIAPPTVTNTAIYLAYAFGCSRIFLAGADFCYTKDGFSHAKGSKEYTNGPQFKMSGVEVETYEGILASTRLDYAFARNMLEEQIKAMMTNSKECQIFNIACTAAKLHMLIIYH